MASRPSQEYGNHKAEIIHRDVDGKDDVMDWVREQLWLWKGSSIVS